MIFTELLTQLLTKLLTQLLSILSIQSTTVPQCPAKVFSKSKILNTPNLNLQSQRLNAFVYTGSKAIS